MSSACVCHTDEWCFYHEMYVPIERKVERMEIYLDMIIRTTDRPYAGEAYSLSGHMNAVEYAKRALNKEEAK